MAGRNLISQNDSTQKASLLRVVVGRGERSTPGLRLFLRLLSRSRFSCGYVSLGLGGWFCEVCPCDPCARVRPGYPCVSRLPPVSFYLRPSRVSRVSRLPRLSFYRYSTGTISGAFPAGRTGSMLHRTFYVVELGVKRSGSCHVAGERQPV